jgi:predicted transcriptional regulator
MQELAKGVQEEEKEERESSIDLSPETYFLLQAMRDGRVNEVIPQLEEAQGEDERNNSIPRYPIAEQVMGTSRLQTIRCLEEATQAGLLIMDKINISLSCPNCKERSFVSTDKKCPCCGSAHVEMGNVLEHLYCTYLGFEKDFVDKVDGTFRCPKCNRPLFESGVDYLRLGDLYRCASCKIYTRTPIEVFICEKCKYHSDGEREKKKNDEGSPSQVRNEVFSYLPSKKFEQSYDKYSVNLEPILEELKQKNWFGIQQGSLIGKSGLEHRFTLVFFSNELDVREGSAKETSMGEGARCIRPKSSLKRRLSVVDVVACPGGVSAGYVLAFFAKCFDCIPSERIFVAIPRLSRDARKLAESYNINVEEALTFEEASRKLLEMVRKSIETEDKKYSMKAAVGASKDGGKRTTFDIITDILMIASAPASKTEILSRANLSFNQAKKYLRDLEVLGFLRKYFEDGVRVKFVITEKGKEHLSRSNGFFGRIAGREESIWSSRRR